jgi:hypothetical protein
MITLLLCEGEFILHAQSWEFGGVLHYISIGGSHLDENPGDPNSLEKVEVNGLLGLGGIKGGLNIRAFRINKEMSLGIMSGLELGKCFLFSGDGDAPSKPAFNFHLPVYLTWRYGAGSGKDSEYPAGIGIGLGYQFSNLLANTYNMNPDDEGFYSFFHPALMTEVVFDQGRRRNILDNLKIRAELQLGTFKQDFYSEMFSLNYGYTFNQFSISVIRFLDYK